MFIFSADRLLEVNIRKGKKEERQQITFWVAACYRIQKAYLKYLPKEEVYSKKESADRPAPSSQS